MEAGLSVNDFLCPASPYWLRHRVIQPSNVSHTIQIYIPIVYDWHVRETVYIDKIVSYKRSYLALLVRLVNAIANKVGHAEPRTRCRVVDN